jgi:hypothetical protein
LTSFLEVLKHSLDINEVLVPKHIFRVL